MRWLRFWVKYNVSALLCLVLGGATAWWDGTVWRVTGDGVWTGSAGRGPAGAHVTISSWSRENVISSVMRWLPAWENGKPRDEADA